MLTCFISALYKHKELGCCAVLCCAVLCCAVLCCAQIEGSRVCMRLRSNPADRHRHTAVGFNVDDISREHLLLLKAVIDGGV